MYFYIKAIYTDDEGGVSEWITKANSEKEALSELEDDMQCVEFKEMSITECVNYEEEKLRELIKYEYLDRRFGNITVKEYVQRQREIKNNPEKYYEALVDFNRAQSLTRRLARRKNFGNLTMTEYYQSINALLDAKNEEEFNKILHKADDD